MSSGDKGVIHWDAYASQYDLLAANNPSYRENIDIVRALVDAMGLPEGASICDLGAGTGNYICELSRDLESARFFYVDADDEMSRIAAMKFRRLGLENVSFVKGSVFDIEFDDHSFDLILCVNALYAMSPQKEVLANVRRWLKPSGRFLVIDFGRKTRVFDWGRFILGSMIKEKGLVESFRFLVDGLETLRQNRKGSKAQSEGIYWLHSTEEFGSALAQAGFLVEELRTCYRGYCDLAVCRPAD